MQNKAGKTPVLSVMQSIPSKLPAQVIARSFRPQNLNPTQLGGLVEPTSRRAKKGRPTQSLTLHPLQHWRLHKCSAKPLISRQRSSLHANFCGHAAHTLDPSCCSPPCSQPSAQLCTKPCNTAFARLGPKLDLIAAHSSSRVANVGVRSSASCASSCSISAGSAIAASASGCCFSCLSCPHSH